ncbi:MAG TPA: class F sortase [Amycolatopsis sp.]|uniref:class F sortase n=1 Tax=Amycolatopsis sp. TaxID=37632 RepID=UPI002B470F13|nr:class F sortase [Amycolatopsis sp.]HKS49700.1 class F sortase [Amycolatopsis sp.]
MHTPPPAGYLRTFLLGVCLGLAVLTGCTGTDVAPAPQPAPGTASTVEPGPGATGAAPPIRVRIPKISADSTLVQLGVNDDGTIQVPPTTEPMQAGWYRFSPPPGAVGPAVLLGHVDGTGHKGIFYDLKSLAPGDEIEVDRADGTTARFRVDHLSQVPKNQFPTEAVYGNTDTPQLRLITCGGDFDRAAHSYRDNIIVYAGLAAETR